MDWIDTYLKHTTGTPSPDIFRLWSAITAVSGAVERRVWVETGKGKLYPNLYTLLVGPPGSGKSQAIDPVKELWMDQKELKVAPDNVTKAALIDVLQKNARWLIRDDVENGALEYHTTLVPCPEFGVLMSKHDLDFISVLNHIYDNPKNYREERRSMEGRNPDVTNPQIVMLAGTQPDFLASVLPEEAWGMGFCSRIIMVYAPEAPKFELFGENMKEDCKVRESLMTGMAAMGELYGKIEWSIEAQVSLKLWWDQGLPTPAKPFAPSALYGSALITHY